MVDLLLLGDEAQVTVIAPRLDITGALCWVCESGADDVACDRIQGLWIPFLLYLRLCTIRAFRLSAPLLYGVTGFWEPETLAYCLLFLHELCMCVGDSSASIYLMFFTSVVTETTPWRAVKKITLCSNILIG